MNRDTAESYGKEALIRLVLSQAETIAVLTREMAVLRARVAGLEAKPGLPAKTPDNSGTPRPPHPNPAHKRGVMAPSCQHCGTDVSSLPRTAREVHDRLEIPGIKPDATRVTLHGGVCPCCAEKFKAAPPSGMEPGSPSGENLRAPVNMLDAARGAFARQTSHIRARLMPGTILQSGETGLRAGKRNWRPRVFHHDGSAVFVIGPPRGKKAAGGVPGAFRPGFRVPDRYGGQMGWAGTNNQVCLAHLIRGVQYAIGAGGGIFAPGLRHLPGRACRIGRRRDKLADATLKTYAARLEARPGGLMARPPAHAAGVKLQRVIKKIRRHLSVSVTSRAIPAASNGSGRALRPCVIFGKITNGFRTGWGARLYAGIRSKPKPHAAEPSAPWRRSASPSQESLFPQRRSSRMSNYEPRWQATI
jgi:transposase